MNRYIATSVVLSLASLAGALVASVVPSDMSGYSNAKCVTCASTGCLNGIELSNTGCNNLSSTQCQQDSATGIYCDGPVNINQTICEVNNGTNCKSNGTLTCGTTKKFSCVWDGSNCNRLDAGGGQQTSNTCKIAVCTNN